MTMQIEKGRERVLGVGPSLLLKKGDKMDNEKKEVEIGRIVKNNRITTLVRLLEFKGEKYIDIRDFTTGSNNNVYPTTKGVATPVRFISELVTLFEKAEREIQQGDHYGI